MAENQSTKKVLFIAYQIPPIAGPAVQRHLRFLVRLDLFGWSPFVLTVNPKCAEDYYPMDRSLMKKMPIDIPIERTRSFNPMDKLLSFRQRLKSRLCANKAVTPAVPKENEKRGRLVNKIKDFIPEIFRTPDRQIGWYLFAFLKGSKIIRNHRIDAIYSSGNPWTCHLVALSLARLFGVPWIADFRDPWTQNPYKDRQFEIFERINQLFEHQVVKNASFVVCNTIPLRERMENLYEDVDPYKYVYISNGYWKPLFQQLEYNKTDNRLIISHAGTLYARRSPISILKAISALKKKRVVNNDNFLLKFVGGKGISDINTDLLATLDIVDLVKFTPRVEHHDALQILAQSDVLLLIQPDTKLQIPGKLFEYMAVGHPILAIAGDGATSDLIESEKIGFVVNPKHIDALEELIKFLMEKFKKGDPLKIMPAESHAKYESLALTEKLVELFERSIEKRKIDACCGKK